MRTLLPMTATAVAFCCFSSSVARAQGSDSGAIDLHASFAGRWVPARESRALPLQKRVRLDLTGARLQDALQAIARQAGLKLGFSGDVPRSPVRISLKSDGLTVLAALTQVLEGTGFEPFVSLRGDAVLVAALPAAPAPTGSIVGRVTDAKTGAAIAGATVVVEGTSRSATTANDGRYRVNEVPPGTYTVRARYIGYAPASASATVSADQEATADFALEKSAQKLDEVVTTGTVVPTEVKALPTPISVLTSEDIQRKNLQRVDQVFRGDVPGATAWDLGPFDYFSSISVRGATQLSGQGSLKTFIDGVEVANPTFVATIDPNSIDRIEITRGPQASTLYGAGALNGVMQIFTKKESAGLARPEITAKLSVGGVGGFDGQSTAPQTDNALSVLGGNQAASYNRLDEYTRINGGPPFGRNLDLWRARAPGFNLDRVTAALRVEAIGLDDVLFEWEPYAGLLLQHKPVELFVIPEGTHLLIKPWERLASSQGNADWFRFWLKAEEDPDPARADQYARWRELRKLQQHQSTDTSTASSTGRTK